MFKFVFSSFISIAFASVIYLAWLYIDMQKTLDTPMTLENSPLLFTVKPGDSMKAISKRLNAMNAYKHPELLRLTAKLRELDSRVHVGEYQITEGMTANDFLTMVTEGKVLQHSIILLEGWTFRQFLDALANKDDLKKELTGMTNEQIMTKLGKSGQHPEGRFFPDNYFYTTGSSDLDILQRAYAAMEKITEQFWQNRQKDLPYKTPYEALTMASIIEKETGKADERPAIAGVFVRRLQKGMKLQTDPTVIYGIGSEFDGNITRKHLQTDTPYNTYTRAGLPPSPIAMFGTASLEAALDPAEGDALFFVAKGDGSHHFSATFKEHNNAVAKYQLGK